MSCHPGQLSPSRQDAPEVLRFNDPNKPLWPPPEVDPPRKSHFGRSQLPQGWGWEGVEVVVKTPIACRLDESPATACRPGNVVELIQTPELFTANTASLTFTITSQGFTQTRDPIPVEWEEEPIS